MKFDSISLNLHKLVRVGCPACLQSLHGREVNDEHDEVEEADIVAVRVEPERQHTLIHHHALHHQGPHLRHQSRPDQVLIVSLRNHESNKGEDERYDCAGDVGLADGILTGRTVEVEPAKGHSTGKEGEVVEVVVLVEAGGAVHKLRVTVIPLQHLVDEVESWYTGQNEENGEPPRSRLHKGLLHHCYLLIHQLRNLLLLLTRTEPKLTPATTTTTVAPPHTPPQGAPRPSQCLADHDLYKMDFILAHSRYQRRKYAEAIQVCDQLLQRNGKDEAAWMLKCQCLIKENYVDELETEEEGMAELMIKEEDANRFARVGTSFKNANSHANPVMRPTTGGRLNTGFQRAGTSASRAGSRQGGMLRTGRVMTKGGIPTTSSGRILRLSTASLEQYGQNFFDSSKVDLRKVAQRRSKSRLIFQYLFYVEHNLKKCLQLAVIATELNNYEDPWWKVALGKCYYHLNFLKEAERQFLSSARHNNNIESSLYLSRIYEKEDNVDRSINVLEQAKKLHPFQPKLEIAIGRIYDQLQNIDKSHEYYKNALAMQNCNTEAVANIASYYFYKDQPEISLKLYQRLIELGCESPEIWNNMGLCCFSNHQYHLYYNCFERAILTSRDDPDLFSDVWYNIGYIYTIFGQLELAVEAFKITLNYRPDHYQALNNLAVIESKRGNVDSALNYAEKSWREVPNLEAAYNLSIWYFKTNQLEKANAMNKEALKLYPQHAQSKQLATRLLRKLDTL